MAVSIKSTSGTVGSTLTIEGLDPNYQFNEVGITFYSDATLDTVVDTGMTGTVALSGVPLVNEYESPIQNGTIDAAVSTDFETPLRLAVSMKKIVATPTSITGATHWQLIVAGHEE